MLPTKHVLPDVWVCLHSGTPPKMLGLLLVSRFSTARGCQLNQKTKRTRRLCPGFASCTQPGGLFATGVYVSHGPLGPTQHPAPEVQHPALAFCSSNHRTCHIIFVPPKKRGFGSPYRGDIRPAASRSIDSKVKHRLCAHLGKVWRPARGCATLQSPKMSLTPYPFG